VPFVNVFASGLRLPPRVCIVAPGPNGPGNYRKIPPDVYVIAVSKAVLVPSIRPRLWVMTHSHQDWYPEADRAFRGDRVFGELAMRDVCPPAGATWYCFDTAGKSLSPDHLRPVDGCIRVGGTVTGCALQLAYNLGATTILLCGADMSGDGYWDGTSNPQPAHGSTWPAARCVNLLARWMMEEKGLRIATLSPTRLAVPAYQPDPLGEQPDEGGG
jgi:hypothetical protein